MSRTEQTYRRLLRLSLIIAIVSLVLFLISLFTLVITGGLTCDQGTFCTVDEGLEILGVSLYLFGSLMIASTIAARVFDIMMKKQSDLMDASSYRQELRKKNLPFSQTNVYKVIKQDARIEYRRDIPFNEKISFYRDTVKQNIYYFPDEMKELWSVITDFFGSVFETFQEKAQARKERKEMLKTKAVEHSSLEDLIQDEEPTEDVSFAQSLVEQEETKEVEPVVEEEPESTPEPEPEPEKAPEPEPEPEKEPEPVVVVAPVVEEKPEPEEEFELKKVKKKKKIRQISKTDIIERMASTTDISKNKANKFLKSLFKVIEEGLIERQDIELETIGVITTILMPAKDAVNPQTGEAIVVPAHHQVRFRFDEDLKDEMAKLPMDEVEYEYIRVPKVKKSTDKLEDTPKEEVKEKPVEEKKPEPVPVVKEEKKEEEPKPKPAKPKKPKPKQISKTDIINRLADTTDISKNKASKFLKSMFDVIQTGLIEREDVELEGLGFITTIQMPAKDAVNPQTGESIVVPEHYQVRFRFDEDLKDKMND